MKENVEKDGATIAKRISTLHKLDKLMDVLLYILVIVQFISILSGSDRPISDLLGIIVALHIGIWILKEQSEEKQRNIGHEKTTKLYYYLGALYLVLMVTPFFWSTTNFSKSTNYIFITAYIISFLVMITILFFREITSKNK